MSEPNPASTEWIVIRPAADIVNNAGKPSPADGQWRRRSELADETFVEFDGAHGVIRAYPTDRIERSGGGDRGQVYEVRDGTEH